MNNQFVLQAEEMFKNNVLNCAEAVLFSVLKSQGTDDEFISTVLKMATGFGGGFGCGQVCGAISGGVMATGYKLGRNLDNGNIAAVQKANAAKICNCFTEKMGSFLCDELTSQYERGSKEHKAYCANLISLAANCALDIYNT